MGDRRMLTRKVTDNDNFIKLPATAQALYMHLTLSADDDGFCSQIETAMFRAHAKKKDLEALVDKRYLLRFENGVMVIKHWRMANAMRKDRYEPTVYQEEANMLTIKPNGAYTMATDWQPNGNQTQPHDNQPQPQVKLSKVKLSQDKINTGDSVCDARAHAGARETPPDPDPDRWDEFWDAYPRKSGGDIREACMEYMRVIDSGVPPDTLISAATELAQRTTPDMFRYLPSAEKWLRNKGWLEKPPDGGIKTSNPFLRMMIREGATLDDRGSD